jgi:hypothetical protein
MSMSAPVSEKPRDIAVAQATGDQVHRVTALRDVPKVPRYTHLRGAERSHFRAKAKLARAAGATFDDLVSQSGLSRSTIHTLLKEAGITSRPRSAAKRKERPSRRAERPPLDLPVVPTRIPLREPARSEFCVKAIIAYKHYSLREIAAHSGRSPDFVARLLREAGIEIRPPGGRHSLAGSGCSLTDA